MADKALEKPTVPVTERVRQGEVVPIATLTASAPVPPKTMEFGEGDSGILADSRAVGESGGGGD